MTSGPENRHRADPALSPHRLFPTWKGNLLLFGVLIIIVLAYFYWQYRQAQQTFIEHVRGYSAMLADVIDLNAKGAILSEEIVEQAMRTFLGNAARFVDYLNSVEPFISQELTSFAAEAGLAGIRITGADGQTEGPPGWLSLDDVNCGADNAALEHLSKEHLYFLSVPKTGEAGCIVVGLTAAHIEKLHEQSGLPHLLATLPGLAGIRYARIEKDRGKGTARPRIALIEENGRMVAESRMPLGNDLLVVALDTRHFLDRVNQLRAEIIVLSAILAVLGASFSWLLYRYQNLYLDSVRDFERQIAKQREDAALGQAAASITHEIRNPLNAISMGLQRMQWEVSELPEEYRELLSNMQLAVKRTNGIVTNIRRYARPLEPDRKPVSLETVVNQILSLYGQKCEAHAITVSFEIVYKGHVGCDPDLIAEVVENLVKNAIEAQETGGFIRIAIDRTGPEAILAIQNGGFSLASEDAEQILEPYFTTKTRGTGLGLAIAERIVNAHGGRLEINAPSEGVLQVSVGLPLERM